MSLSADLFADSIVSFLKESLRPVSISDVFSQPRPSTLSWDAVESILDLEPLVERSMVSETVLDRMGRCGDVDGEGDEDARKKRDDLQKGANVGEHMEGEEKEVKMVKVMRFSFTNLLKHFVETVDSSQQNLTTVHAQKGHVQKIKEEADTMITDLLELLKRKRRFTLFEIKAYTGLDLEQNPASILIHELRKRTHYDGRVPCFSYGPVQILAALNSKNPGKFFSWHEIQQQVTYHLTPEDLLLLQSHPHVRKKVESKIQKFEYRTETDDELLRFIYKEFIRPYTLLHGPMPAVMLEFQYGLLVDQNLLSKLKDHASGTSKKKSSALFTLEELSAGTFPNGIENPASYNWIENHIKLFPSGGPYTLSDAANILTQPLFFQANTIKRLKEKEKEMREDTRIVWLMHRLASEPLEVQKASIIDLIKAKKRISQSDIENSLGLKIDANLFKVLLAFEKIRFDEATQVFWFYHAHVEVYDIDSMFKLIESHPFGIARAEIEECYPRATTDVAILIDTKRVFSFFNSETKLHILYPAGLIVDSPEADADLQASWSEVRLPEDVVSLDLKLKKFGVISEEEFVLGHQQRAKHKAIAKRKNVTADVFERLKIHKK